MPPQDVSLDIFGQRIQNLELKIDTLQKSIQSLRDDFITKQDQIISFQRQLFQAITCQFKDVANDLFTKSLQGAFAAAAASMAVQSSQQD